MSTLAAGSAHAVQVTWSLSGTIDLIDSHAAELSSLGVVVGTPFTASFTFESATPASNPSDPLVVGCCGSYQGAVLEATFDAGTYSVAYTAPAENWILTGVGINEFRIEVAGSATPTLLDPRLQLSFIDSLAGGLSLPIAPPVYSGTQREIFVYASDSTFAIHASDFTIGYTVPEAGTSAPLALFAAAFATRIAARRARGFG